MALFQNKPNKLQILKNKGTKLYYQFLKLTSGGVAAFTGGVAALANGVIATLAGGVEATLGDRRSIEGFELIDRGDLSIESREFCRGECESVSGLVTPFPTLLTLGVAGEALLGVSDKADLLKFKILSFIYQIRTHYIEFVMPYM